MEYWLQIKNPEIPFTGEIIVLNFGDNQGSRGAVISGLGKVKEQVEVTAWDIDHNGKRWDKEV